jgi:hypothetical protein
MPGDGSNFKKSKSGELNSKKNEENNRKNKIRDCAHIYKRRFKKAELSEFRFEFFEVILSCSIGGYPPQQI